MGEMRKIEREKQNSVKDKKRQREKDRGVIKKAIDTIERNRVRIKRDGKKRER